MRWLWSAFAGLAAGFGVGTATAWRYVSETCRPESELEIRREQLRLGGLTRWYCDNIPPAEQLYPDYTAENEE